MKPTIKPLVRMALLGAAGLGLAVSAGAQTAAPRSWCCPSLRMSSPIPSPTRRTRNPLALYSGTSGAYSPPGSGLPLTIPTSAEGIQLAGCGFGQMLALAAPFPDFETETIRIAQEKLYPPVTATTREQIAGCGAAFRYKELLYTNDGSNVRAAFEGIATYFDDVARQKARDGIEILRRALRYSPLNTQLRNALLDAYYDFIVAEAQYVKATWPRSPATGWVLPRSPPATSSLITRSPATPTSCTSTAVSWTNTASVLSRAGLTCPKWTPAPPPASLWGNGFSSRNNPSATRWPPSTGTPPAI